MIEHIKLALAENELLQGGLVITVITWLGYQLRAAPGQIWSASRKWLCLEAQFDAGDEAFDSLCHWCIRLYETTSRGSFTCMPVGHESKLIPCGVRWKWVKGCLLITHLTRRELETPLSGVRSVTFSLGILVVGRNRKQVLQDIVDEAKELFDASRDTTLWVRDGSNGYWECFCKLKPRPMESVFMARRDELVQDLDEFLKAEDWYNDHAIPYRRGYLLHGPPGTGKTSLLKAVANHVKRDLSILNLTDLTADRLRYLFSKDDQLICIEDIDAATRATRSRAKDSEDDEEGREPLTLADLLNAIDGVTTGHGIILFMTTNHPDKIDPALKRPGRVDKVIEMTYICQEQFNEACLAFFGREADFQVPEGLTPARIQQVAQECKFDYETFKVSI